MFISAKNWNIEEMTGYKPISTFYTDLGLAEPFGLDAIKDTYKRCFEEWKSDYKMLTELVMALNWKSWEHADNAVCMTPICRLYINLFNEADEYATTHLKGEELDYFYSTTD